MPNNLTTIILTYNEEIHIDRAINNVSNWSEEIIVLDSYSEDRTIDIATRKGCTVYQRKFDNYATQRTYAIKELPIKSDWILFLDADEYLTEEIKKEITKAIVKTDFDGFYLKRRFVFRGKWIKYGGYYPIWILRLFKKSKASVSRAMNEHIIVDGNVGFLKHDFIDHNLKSFSEWIQKHKRYAELEANELINSKKSKDGMTKLFGSQPERKRWIRYYIWNKLPVFIRPFLYGVYVFLFRLGFLDGYIGCYYHFKHSVWFYTLVDWIYLKKVTGRFDYDK